MDERDVEPINKSTEFISKSEEEQRKTKLDQYMMDCCHELHQSLNHKISIGQTEVCKDERFVQAYFYDIVCSRLSPTVATRVKLEYPHALLQVFKETKRGSPRKIDLVIKKFNDDAKHNDVLLSLEIKLSSNLPTLISDVIRLTHLRYHGSYGNCLTKDEFGGSRVCMMLLVGDRVGVGNFHLGTRELKTGEITPYLVDNVVEIKGINEILDSYDAVLMYDSSNSGNLVCIKLWKICIPRKFNILVPRPKK